MDGLLDGLDLVVEAGEGLLAEGAVAAERADLVALRGDVEL